MIEALAFSLVSAWAAVHGLPESSQPVPPPAVTWEPGAAAASVPSDAESAPGSSSSDGGEVPSPGVPVSPPSTVPPSEPAPPAVHDVGTSLVPDAAPGVGLNGADYCVHPVGVEVLWDDAGLEVLSERVIYADGCDQ